eukprot:CAMPEP_0198286428 /NCGR_PEP_ID=MMETSP1449-20131203/5515_1 /TAXON_ID=420275 /ORGANISM="Attheya septentrionalis, Strain CCMP2084" /LENGTH=601 /DNA_ID=CAMNT_0043984165 /DNA_START=102 /DNA_END=1907 /DNA_ORIENTATION=+
MAKRSKLPRPKFPRPYDYEGVYDSTMIHRDNSTALEILEEWRSLVLTRPMQMGKTTLFSLAQLVYSKASTAPTGLEYDCPTKNTWYVLRVDFGAVHASFDEADPWNLTARKYDSQALDTIRDAILGLVHTHDEIEQKFDTSGNLDELGASRLLQRLGSAVQKVNNQAKLLVLVDEYDQPIREVLLGMLNHRHVAPYAQIEMKLKSAYPNYIGFFKACKWLTQALPASKVWLTGITPIALNVLSGFTPKNLMFDEDIADAIGLLDDDVDRMLDEVHEFMPFQDDGEKMRVRDAIKKHYNGLQFLSGSRLYHTRMLNSVMHSLMKTQERRDWLCQLKEPCRFVEAEKPPSSLFNVVKHAPNLCPVVGKLISSGEVSGYSLNLSLNLMHILKPDILIADYLTLLVHLGVLSVHHGNQTGEDVFKLASGVYRSLHLEPLLKASLGELLQLSSLSEIYRKGEKLITDFVSTLSESTMSSLIAWAVADPDNHIMELQLQGFMVGELHNVLYEGTTVAQETVLPNKKRTDITLAGDNSLVLLELKKLNGSTEPTFLQKKEYHAQLRGYITQRAAMEQSTRQRMVAGFLVVMYDDGQKYIVEKLLQETS